MLDLCNQAISLFQPSGWVTIRPQKYSGHLSSGGHYTQVPLCICLCNLPLQVLVFEDAPNGLESAKAAGMNVVMVPDGRTDPQKCLKADSVLGSLEELDLTEWGLPPISREI